MHLVRHISLEVFRQDLTRVDRRRDSQAYPRSLQAFPTYPQCCKQDLANCTNLKPPSPNVVMHVCTCAEAQQTSHTRVARPTAVRNRDWRLDFSAHRGAATWRDWSMGCWGLPGRVEREQRERERVAPFECALPYVSFPLLAPATVGGAQCARRRGNSSSP